MSSVWKKIDNELEIKFRMEKCKWVREACDYHKQRNEFDDERCWDCGHYEWAPCRFEESILERIDNNGYFECEEGRFRVYSNSLASSKKTIRQQVQEALAKKTTRAIE